MISLSMSTLSPFFFIIIILVFLNLNKPTTYCTLRAYDSYFFFRVIRIIFFHILIFFVRILAIIILILFIIIKLIIITIDSTTYWLSLTINLFNFFAILIHISNGHFIKTPY